MIKILDESYSDTYDRGDIKSVIDHYHSLKQKQIDNTTFIKQESCVISSSCFESFNSSISNQLVSSISNQLVGFPPIAIRENEDNNVESLIDYESDNEDLDLDLTY